MVGGQRHDPALMNKSSSLNSTDYSVHLNSHPFQVAQLSDNVHSYVGKCNVRRVDRICVDGSGPRTWVPELDEWTEEMRSSGLETHSFRVNTSDRNISKGIFSETVDSRDTLRSGSVMDKLTVTNCLFRVGPVFWLGTQLTVSAESWNTQVGDSNLRRFVCVTLRQAPAFMEKLFLWLIEFWILYMSFRASQVYNI